MADFPQFNRNYGAMVTAKEFWGGNNGFVTVGVQMPSADYELSVGAAYEVLAKKVRAGTATDAELVQVSNAERNLFRVAQAISQRAVLVAISGGEVLTAAAGPAAAFPLTKLDDVSTTVGGNVLAGGKGGVTSTAPGVGAPVYFITFMIERADALNKQENKPGATYNRTIDPCAELVDMFLSPVAPAVSPGFFESKTFTQDPDGKMTAGARSGATGAVVKVFDALPVLK